MGYKYGTGCNTHFIINIKQNIHQRQKNQGMGLPFWILAYPTFIRGSPKRDSRVESNDFKLAFSFV